MNIWKEWKQEVIKDSWDYWNVAYWFLLIIAILFLPIAWIIKFKHSRNPL